MNGRAARVASRLRDAPELGALEPPVVVGCSGGADSGALLALACAAGLQPVAVYVDHGLRPESGRDGEVVAELATSLGARFEGRAVHVGFGPNLEARARDARLAALEAAAAAHGARHVLLAHTADDRAETFLLNLMRGAGRRGLAAPRLYREPFVRPLLAMRRADTVEMCARIGHAPVVDAMNDDLAHRRVWVRRELLPRLAAGADRDIVEVLTRQAEVFEAEDVLLDELARRGWPGEHADAAALVALPVPLARRALRQWLGGPVSVADLDRVLAVARGERRATEITSGRRVARRANRLYADARSSPVEVVPAVVAVPGSFAAGAYVLDARVEHAPPVAWPDPRVSVVLDAAVVGGNVRVRASRSGAPVVAHAGSDEVLWVVGRRAAGTARVGPHTRRFLWLSIA